MKPPTMKTGGAPPLPAGLYAARCHLMCFCGTIAEDTPWGHKERPKVVLGFTYPTETHVFDEEKGPQPYQKSQVYTFSFHQKSRLRKDLEAWRGQKWTEEWPDFDIEKVLGTAVLHSVINSEDGSKWYIDSMMRIKDQNDCPSLEGAPILFDVRTPDMDAFERLPNFVQEMVKESAEWQAFDADVDRAAVPAGAVEQEEEDDIPF